MSVPGNVFQSMRCLLGPFPKIEGLEKALKVAAYEARLSATRAAHEDRRIEHELLLEAAESATEAFQAINRYCEAVLKLNGLPLKKTIGRILFQVDNVTVRWVTVEVDDLPNWKGFCLFADQACNLALVMITAGHAREREAFDRAKRKAEEIAALLREAAERGEG